MSEKNQKTGYWVRSGTYSMLYRASTVLFGFGAYLFLVRYYPVEEFGVWSLYVLVSSAVEMSRSSFIQNAYVKISNEKDVDRDNVFTASLFLNAASTMAFVIIMAALVPVMQSYWSSYTVGILVLWYCATSTVLIGLTQLNYLEQANHSFAGIFWSSAVRQGSFFVIVVVCYFYFPGLPLVFFAAAQCVGAFLGVLTSLLFTGKMLPGKYTLEWPLVNRLYKFGRYILGTGITSTVGKYADQAILGRVSHSKTAIYNSAVRIMNFIEIPTLAISTIVYPKIAEKAHIEGAEGVGQLYEKSVATILGLILPVIIGVALVPRFVLSLTAGPNYLEAAGVLRLMALSAILLPFNVQIGSVCEVMNRPHISFYINLVSNILNVVLNLILIPFFGMMGAALALSITIAVIFAVGQYYVKSQFNINGFGAFMRIIPFYKDGITRALDFVKRR